MRSLIIAVALIPTLAAAQTNIESGFRSPPPSARPHTWWHWVNGNVTKEGITADLEAMKRVGVGGAQIFNVDVGIPAGPAPMMGPKWTELIAHAIKEAHRLGIELCIHNCGGWSSSGGPWITPEHAMQVLAWSETGAHGPTRFADSLPQPKALQVYANVPYYRDIAVFAFRTPAAGLPDPSRRRAYILPKSAIVRDDGEARNPNLTPPGAPIPRTDFIDLTGKMDASGRLTWDVPEGDWTILRIGHVPTGKDNHPSPVSGRGLEVDKLSREALDSHWAGMMATVVKAAGPLAGKTRN